MIWIPVAFHPHTLSQWWRPRNENGTPGSTTSHAVSRNCAHRLIDWSPRKHHHCHFENETGVANLSHRISHLDILDGPGHWYKHQVCTLHSIFKTSWTSSFHFAHHLLAKRPNGMNSKPSWKESGVNTKKNPYGIIVWAWACTRDRHHLFNDMLFDITGHCHYQKWNHDDYNRVPSQQWLIETCRPM